MTQELVFTNGRMVTPGKVMAGSLMARDGQITAIDSSGSYLPGAIDLEGDYLLPGVEARDMYRPSITARTAAARTAIAPGG